MSRPDRPIDARSPFSPRQIRGSSRSDELNVVRELIEGMLLRHEAKRWAA